MINLLRHILVAIIIAVSILLAMKAFEKQVQVQKNILYNNTHGVEK